jgi:hypothetical protein
MEIDRGYALVVDKARAVLRYIHSATKLSHTPYQILVTINGLKKTDSKSVFHDFLVLFGPIKPTQIHRFTPIL